MGIRQLDLHLRNGGALRGVEGALLGVACAHAAAAQSRGQGDERTRTEARKRGRSWERGQCRYVETRASSMLHTHAKYNVIGFPLISLISLLPVRRMDGAPSGQADTCPLTECVYVRVCMLCE
eukprot:6610434-Prymnesium_polylepis.1